MSQQAIDVLVRSALLWTAWIAEVHLDVDLLADLTLSI